MPQLGALDGAGLGLFLPRGGLVHVLVLGLVVARHLDAVATALAALPVRRSRLGERARAGDTRPLGSVRLQHHTTTHT